MKMGLVFVFNGKLGYSPRHGHLQWAPEFLQRLIVAMFNFVVCHLRGHNWYPDIDEDNWATGVYPYEVCVSCCKRRLVKEKLPS